ncbi:MAG: PIN domain-containing protein [Candidatus Humimicrobiaceae bacterium]
MELSKILIDTNIYSEFMRGDNKVKYILSETQLIGISVISIGELLSGFKDGINEEKNRKELSFFLDSPRVKVYNVDIETSEFYSKVITDLKNSGNPIPTNDIWIASIAFQNGLKVFTLDNHFQKVPGLFLINY